MSSGEEEPASGLRPSARPPSAAFLAAIVLVAGIAAYINSFGAPFVFDDVDYIVENPVIKRAGLFPYGREAAWLTGSYNVRSTLKTRAVGYLSFALNYRLGGLSPWGYHAVNLLVHLASALLVGLLVWGAFRTPGVRGSRLVGGAHWAGLAAALIFVTHPAQTQAVTYVTQRFASLSALFYLGAVFAYGAHRLAGGRARGAGLYALALLLTVLAMKTKETGFTVPFALALCELCFFGRQGEPAVRRAALLIPFALTLPIVPYGIINVDAGPVRETLASAMRTEPAMPRAAYLATELRVLMTYARLYMLPVNLNLDYAYPIEESLAASGALFGFAAAAAAIGAAATAVLPGRKLDPAMRIAAFGVLWFYLTASVESSVVVLEDVIFEHRMYLPSAGVFSALAVGGMFAAERCRCIDRRALVALGSLAALFVLFSLARNATWLTPEGVWEDVVRKSPGKLRGYANLGFAYMTHGEAERAVTALERGLELSAEPPGFSHVESYNALGAAYIFTGKYEKAFEALTKARDLNPRHARTYTNLAAAYGLRGQYAEALAASSVAVELNPNDHVAHSNLGLSMASLGRKDDALREYAISLALNPEYGEAHYNLGMLHLSMARPGPAHDEYLALVGLRHPLAMALYDEIAKRSAPGGAPPPFRPL